MLTLLTLLLPSPVPIPASYSTSTFVNGDVALQGYAVSRVTIQEPEVLSAVKSAIVDHVNVSTRARYFSSADVYILNVTGVSSGRRLQVVRSRRYSAFAFMVAWR